MFELDQDGMESCLSRVLQSMRPPPEVVRFKEGAGWDRGLRGGAISLRDHHGGALYEVGQHGRVRMFRLNVSRVELVIDDYTDDWRCLWWIRVDGLARVVQPPDPEQDPDVAPVIQALRRKYPQYGQTPVLRDPPTLLAIRPARVRSWCASDDAFRALSEKKLGS